MMESLCEDLGLVLQETREGYRLLASAGHPVTIVHSDIDALSDDLEKNRESIVVASQVTQPGSSFSARYAAGLQKAREEIDRVEASSPSIIARLEPMLAALAEDEDFGLVGELHGTISKVLGNVPRHRAVLDLAERMSVECPARLVLPLGCLVRLRNDCEYPDYCALDPRRYGGRRILPAAGSLAFVAGNGYGADERGVVAVFPGTFTTTDGGRWAHPDEHDGYACAVRPEDVEIVSLAETLDGVRSIDTEIYPSHRLALDGEPPRSVLALRSSGRMLIFNTSRYAHPFEGGMRLYAESDQDFDLNPLVRQSDMPTSAWGRMVERLGI